MKLFGKFQVCLSKNSFPLENQEIKVCESIRNGDKHAFESVFKTYYKILCSYANQIIFDADNSEEIVQEMFFQLWQKRDFFLIETSLKSYLFRAVHNSCLNHIKHNKVKLAYSQNIIQNKSNNSDNEYFMDESDELQTLLGNAIEKLPPERKKVFMMIRYEERKYKEVADILGISVKTVENQMGKAMQFLREAMKGYISIFILVALYFLQIIFKIK